MINGLFPQEKPDDMPDRVWETYTCLVWCCNSFGAVTGGLNRCHERWPIVMDEKWGSAIYRYADRARDVIHFLLEDSGRMEEFKQWEKEHKNKEA